jgi:predicted DNA-binding ribbon-helix-helix protein
MAKTTVRLSEFTLGNLKEIARNKDMSVSQLLNEIALQYIGVQEGARMMQIRAARGSQSKARKALEKIRRTDRPLVPGDSSASD